MEELHQHSFLDIPTDCMIIILDYALDAYKRSRPGWNISINGIFTNKVTGFHEVCKYFHDTCFAYASLRCLSLTVYRHPFITEEMISRFTWLRDLDLGPFIADSKSTVHKCRVGDAALTSLTNLTILNISNNYKITDSSLSLLTKLTSLDISSITSTSFISDDSLEVLTNLTELNASDTWSFTGKSISKLTKLTTLNMQLSSINVNVLTGLTNLTILRVANPPYKTLPKLPNLEYLNGNLYRLDSGNPLNCRHLA